MTAEELWMQLESFSYVSFDLFDTLMIRTVKETDDIFDFVEKVYNDSHTAQIKNFRNIRKKAELDTRKVFKEHEINIDAIYEQMPFKKEICDELESVEKKIEIENCLPNKVMISLENRCYEAGKKVIITTDMYLDRETIEAILQRVGVTNYQLFLSSEVNATKVSGKLFPYVLKKLNIDANQIAHIGDNQISDIHQAKQAGITAFLRLIPETSIELYSIGSQKKIANNHLMTFLEQESRMKDIRTPEFRIGYCVLGPVLTEFCQWIHRKKVELDYDRILFVAREGYLIQKMYEQMYPEEMDNISYIRLNKNLLRLPSLYLNPTVEQFLDTIPMHETYSMFEILSYMMVDDRISYLESLHFDESVTLDTRYNRNDMLQGKFSETFERIIKPLNSTLAQQYELLLRYLRDNKIIGNRILLVNNSINGNGQAMLENVLKQGKMDATIMGVQFVRSRRCRMKLAERCTTWLTDGNIPGYYTMSFNRCALLLEHLMFEPSGTALYFEEGNLGVKAVCEPARSEKQNFPVIKEIQSFAMQFYGDYRNTCPMSYGVQVVKLLFEVLDMPFKSDAELLSGLYDDDVDGDKTLVAALNWRQALLVLSDYSKWSIEFLNARLYVKDYVKWLGSKVKQWMKRNQ